MKSALAVGVLLAAASAVWVHDSESQRRSRLIAQAAQAGEAQAQELRAVLQHKFTALEVVVALVQEGRGTVSRFHDIGAELLRNHPGVRALGLLPQGVVTQVVPRVLDPLVLGVDMLHGLQPNPMAQQAVRENSLVVSDPGELPIGGQGLVAHQPVYLFEPGESAPRFWGLVRIAVDTPGLLEGSRLETLKAQGFEHQLVGPSGVLHTSLPLDVVLEEPLVLPVELYNQQ